MDLPDESSNVQSCVQMLPSRRQTVVTRRRFRPGRPSAGSRGRWLADAGM